MALKALPTGDHAIASADGTPPQAYLEWLQSVQAMLTGSGPGSAVTFAAGDLRYERIGLIANFGAALIANYQIALTDVGQTKEMNIAGANTFTIPANATVAFPLGSWLNLVQAGAGQTTITPAGGVTLRARIGLKTAGQWAMVTLYKRATNEWVVGGDVVP